MKRGKFLIHIAIAVVLLCVFWGSVFSIYILHFME